MAPTILITRPADAAAIFAGQLRARLGCGVRIEISPIMEIEPLPNLPDNPERYATLIFTSRNAVKSFCQQTDQRNWPVYCVGDATARLATEMGFTAASAGGAAGDLLELLNQARPATPCLYLRGEHVASDLAKILNSAGIETEDAIVYRQKPLPLTPSAHALLSGDSPVILPLLSPQSARLFFRQNTGTAPLLVAAISDNAAACVPADRTVHLSTASAPTAEAVADVLKPLLQLANRLESGKSAQ